MVRAIAISNNTDEMFVATDGDDTTGDGSEGNPYATIEKAATTGGAGTTVVLRAGNHKYTNDTWTFSGDRDKPIIVRPYPGERPVIHGGQDTYQTPGQSLWTLEDASINLWSTANSTWADSSIRAWLVRERLQLVQYDTLANLQATNYSVGESDAYTMPGLFVDTTDDKLYIRLDVVPADLLDIDSNSIKDPIPTKNPNLLQIAVANNTTAIFLSNCNHVVFRDLTLAYGETILDIRDGSQNISFKNCALITGEDGTVLRNNPDEIYFDRCLFTAFTPEYCSWRDVKSAPNHNYQASHFDGPCLNDLSATNRLRITNCIIERCFDGVKLGAGTTGSLIRNCIFRDVHDDAVLFPPGASDTSVEWNFFLALPRGHLDAKREFVNSQ